MTPPVLSPSPLAPPEAGPAVPVALSPLKSRSSLWIVVTVVAIAVNALSAVAWRALKTSDFGEGFVSGNRTARSNICWSCR